MILFFFPLLLLFLIELGKELFDAFVGHLERLSTVGDELNSFVCKLHKPIYIGAVMLDCIYYIGQSTDSFGIGLLLHKISFRTQLYKDKRFR